MRWTALLIVLVALAGCGELRSPTAPGAPPDPPVDPSATFSRIQSEVFSTSCAFSGCHGSAGTQAGLDLTPGAAYGNLVGVPSTEIASIDRVEPGLPDQSYLYMKVIGASGIIGAQMPLGQPELTTEQKELIRNWILRGAPND